MPAIEPPTTNDRLRRRGHRIRVVALLMLAAVAFAACGKEQTLIGDAGFASGSAIQPTTEESGERAAQPTAATESVVAEATSAPAEPATELTTTQDESTTRDSTEDPAPAVAATGGAASTISNVRVEVGNTEVGTDEDGQAFVAVGLSVDHLGVAEWTKAWRFGSDDDLLLEDPAGRVIGKEAMFDHVGDKISSLDLRSKGHHEVSIVFETAEVVADASDWTLVVSREGTLGAHLPLQGPAYATQYPLSLRSGDEAQVRVFGTNCSDGVAIETIIDRATVALETAGATPERANPGFRWVAIDVAITDTSDLAQGGGGPYYCGNTALWPNVLLMADGVGRAADLHSDPRVKEQASAVMSLGYWVPVETSRIELRIGESGPPIAAWDLALPAVAGESGAELVRGAVTPPGGVTPNGLQPVPTDLTVTELDTDGATENMLLIDYTLQDATSTNAEVVEGIPDAVQAEGRAYVVARVLVESDATAENAVVEEQFFSLVGPDGQAWPAVKMFDETGDDTSRLVFTGRDSDVISVVFETNGLATNADGWAVEISTGSSVPALLPLVGPADLSHTFDLPSGANRAITRGDSSFCKGGRELDARVEHATIGLEGEGRFRYRRANAAERFVTVDLALTHLVPSGGGSSGFDYCGHLAQWPDFRVVADGRASGSLNDLYLVKVAEGATESIRVTFTIPVETRSLELYGGEAPTLIAGWELRDNGAVLTELEAVEIDEQTLVTLNESVLFAFGESTLQRDAEAPLNRLASVLVSGSEGAINVIGHTDAIGDDASNQALSEERAQAVADFLTSAGVDASRLDVTGAGEGQPIAANANDDGSDNPDGRAQNRRVEVRFTAVS